MLLDSMAIGRGKDFGKLTAAQLREFVQFLPELFAIARDVGKQIASVGAEKFDSIMVEDYGDYSQVYELPVVEHLNQVFAALALQEEVAAMAASPDPQEAVLEILREREEADENAKHEAFTNTEVMALAYSLGRTLQSMATYGRSISSLLQDVRETGNHDSLFKAIRMDRSVIGCPTAMRYIAKAQIRSDKRFFKHLQAALAGPSKKPMIGLEPMRYTLLLLREMGVNDLSDKDLEFLMVELLKVYPPVPGAAKNLRAQYQRSRKIQTI